MYHLPHFYYKTKIATFDEKKVFSGLLMVHTVGLYCQNLDKDQNNYEINYLKHDFYVINVTYVISQSHLIKSYKSLI